MPKYVVANVTDVPEVLRSEYEQRSDGKYYLKIEGDIPELVEMKAKLAEFRDTNINLLKERDGLQAKLKTYDGVDVHEYTALKTKVQDFEKKGAKDPADIDTRIKAALEPYIKQVEGLQKEKEDANKRLAFRDLENSFREVAAKVGVDEKALPDFINRGLEIFDLDGVARNGDAPIFSKKDVTKPMSVEEWAESLQQEAPHLFRPSKGGGTTSQAGGGAGKRVIGTDPLEFGRNLEAIAKGDVVVSPSH